VRDWQQWHDDYDDPSSDLSRRLTVVQQRIRVWADGQPPGPLRVLSICAGQAHDLVGALRDHDRRDDVSGLLVELDPENVAAATVALRGAGLSHVQAVVGDASATSAYAGVPADLLLVCGVFGNVPDTDVQRTISALPMLCAPGASVVWTRHRREPDLTPSILTWFQAAGFDAVDFFSPGPGRFSVGTHLLTAAPATYRAGQVLFAFVR
jgi:hypothetical protein